MQMLNRNPAAAYRRVVLDARIEASSAADLTRICLEEAQAALGQAHGALMRGSSTAREPLLRAQSIMVWLARSVAAEHPMRGALQAFYGGLAVQIGEQILQPDGGEIIRIRSDIEDLLAAAA